MCGIAGFFITDKLRPEMMQDMITCMKHRGPDHQSQFNDGRISLGHARLKVIDTSAASDQPYHSPDGRYVMVYNGEVYNFRELAVAMNYKAVTSGDTEIVLEAYLRYGREFVHKLNGMFAIAIYDKQSGVVNLFRDRFGIKPLYYYSDGSNFAFASELKALLKLPLPKEFNQAALNHYLFLEYCPQPSTMIRHFMKLGNGCQLTAKGGLIEIKRYYDILDTARIESELSEGEAMEKFASLFHASIEYRRIADVKVGAFLSGGNDSSAICAGISASKNLLRTFNIGFDDSRFDESGYASKVASILGLQHSQKKFTTTEMLNLQKAIFEHYDEPFAVSSVFPTFLISQVASKEVTVALSGDGGDELFMGYGHYDWYRRLNKMRPVQGLLRKTMSSISPLLSSRYARIASVMDFDNLDNDWPHIWSQEQYMFSEGEISALTGSTYRNVELRQSWTEINKVVADPYKAISIFDIRHYLADDLLYKVDIASMAHGLEVRLPFLDHNLVEFVLSLPTKFKLKGGQKKYLLKKYLEQSLPVGLVHRRKWGFGAPIDQWLMNDTRPLLEEYLNPSRIAGEGHFDPEIVSRLKDEFLSGKNFLYKRLWALIVFGTWRERYFAA